MKKIIFILVFMTAFTGWSFSQELAVSEEKAGNIAAKFFYERISSRKDINPEDVRVTNSFTVTENDQPVYYAVNLSGTGFVVISACQATPPVLCYSLHGSYSQDDQPSNFSAWMEQYRRQIAFAIRSKATATDQIKATWKYYEETPFSQLKPFNGREVLPMTTTTWDQGLYYNEQCPADPAGPGGHCVTGCVATAMGQILNYFRWPESGTGSYSYDCPPYGTLSADFGNASYQYDLMETSLAHSNEEVAELLNHLGVSVDMVYGPDGSGMYNHKAAYSLKTYFKYSPETQYLYRDSTSMDWDSVIVAHLDQEIPLYYAGWSVPGTIGHAFVCDGYQGEDYFHFNWGWGGSYDGYFYTDNLTPGGSDFNLAQELIINAVPDTNLYSYPVYCQGDKVISSLFGTLDDGSGPLYSYPNGSDCTWLITPADSINNITLNFLRFGLDQSDSLTIYDGPGMDSPVLGIFTGNSLPSSVTTTGSSMYIVFASDGSAPAEGFLAGFESEVPVYCQGMVTLNAIADTLFDGSGTWDYHDNSACLWRITPAGASSVTLYFMEFETEPVNDVLKIYDLQTQQLLAEYSGSYESGVPDPVTSPSGKLFLTFSTNYMTTAPGWKAYYESGFVGLEENSDQQFVKIYPNPADEILTIQFKRNFNAPVSLRMNDLSGREVLTEEFSEKSGLITLDLHSLTPGVYILITSTGEGDHDYHKIIIH